MGGLKRKIAIEKRETKEQRSVAFSKRRKGLFKKAADLCLLFDAQIAVLASGPSEKSSDTFYTFGHSSVDTVVDAFVENRPLVRTPQTADASVDLGFLFEPDDLDGKTPEELAIETQNLQEYRISLARALKRKTIESVPSSSGKDSLADATTSQIDSDEPQHSTASLFLTNLGEGFSDLYVDDLLDATAFLVDTNASTSTSGVELKAPKNCFDGGNASPRFWKAYRDICVENANADPNANPDMNENAYAGALMVAENGSIVGPTNPNFFEENNWHEQYSNANGIANSIPNADANGNANITGTELVVSGGISATELNIFCDLLADANTNQNANAGMDMNTNAIAENGCADWMISSNSSIDESNESELWEEIYTMLDEV